MNLKPPPSPLDHLRLASPEVWQPAPLAARRPKPIPRWLAFLARLFS